MFLTLSEMVKTLMGKGSVTAPLPGSDLERLSSV